MSQLHSLPETAAFVEHGYKLDQVSIIGEEIYSQLYYFQGVGQFNLQLFLLLRKVVNGSKNNKVKKNGVPSP